MPHECLLASLLAKQLNLMPIWIPFMYDTATHSAAEGGKIRAPLSVLLKMNSSTQIDNSNPRKYCKDRKASNRKRIRTFLSVLEDHVLNRLEMLQNHFDQYNFGHYLFPLKQAVFHCDRQEIINKLTSLKEILLNRINNALNLGESLGLISQALLEPFGIEFNVGFIERFLPQFVETIFTTICARELIQTNESLLDGLFIHYNIKKKLRNPIFYREGRFIAQDPDQNILFEGSIQDLAHAMKGYTILPTGALLILLFMAMGCQITLGGPDTQTYYPEYIHKAELLLQETPFNAHMEILGYGGIRSMDTRNLTDLLATSRILEKVGSRGLTQKGKITIPHDIIDHLRFLAGKNAVPREFVEYSNSNDQNNQDLQNKLSFVNSEDSMDKDDQNTSNLAIPALDREMLRFNHINLWSSSQVMRFKKKCL